jgi:predicted transcriptional regulator
VKQTEAALDSFTVRLPADLAASLREKAELEDRSMAGLVRTAVRSLLVEKGNSAERPEK